MAGSISRIVHVKVIIMFLVLAALLTARVTHRPAVLARAPRGHAAAEGRGTVNRHGPVVRVG